MEIACCAVSKIDLFYKIFAENSFVKIVGKISLKKDSERTILIHFLRVSMTRVRWKFLQEYAFTYLINIPLLKKYLQGQYVEVMQHTISLLKYAKESLEYSAVAALLLIKFLMQSNVILVEVLYVQGVENRLME